MLCILQQYHWAYYFSSSVSWVTASLYYCWVREYSQTPIETSRTPRPQYAASTLIVVLSHSYSRLVASFFLPSFLFFTISPHIYILRTSRVILPSKLREDENLVSKSFTHDMVDELFFLTFTPCRKYLMKRKVLYVLENKKKLCFFYLFILTIRFLFAFYYLRG